jgi:hypothetical protein
MPQALCRAFPGNNISWGIGSNARKKGSTAPELDFDSSLQGGDAEC